MMITKQFLLIDFMHYGKIRVPGGTKVTDKTTQGDDLGFFAVDEFEFLNTQHPDIAKAVLHDAIHRGIPVPEECVLKKGLPFKTLVDFLPEKTSLTYVDYSDSFEGNEKLLQRIISNDEEERCEAFNTIDEWFDDQRSGNIEEYINQVKEDIVKAYDLTEDEADDIMEVHEESLEEIIRDREEGDYLNDLIKNTGRIIAHYDTGYSMDADSWNWPDYRIRYERMKIKKHLNIKNSEHDRQIDTVICQATYGGQLLIYFDINIRDFTQDISKVKSIEFTDFMFGIVDHGNGSGDVCDNPVQNVTFAIPFDGDNLFLEKSIKYNWTYSIAGMCSDWCSSTKYKLSEEESTLALNESPQKLLNAKEQEYNSVYQSGSCSSGDMDINRHRKVSYRNDYPCGSKCADCGTFWID